MNFAYMNMNSFIYNISTCIMYASSNLCYAVLQFIVFHIYQSVIFLFTPRLGKKREEYERKRIK